MKHKIIKYSLWIASIALVVFIAYGSFFVWKVNTLGKKITLVSSDSQTLMGTLKSLTGKENTALKELGQNRINILLLGIAGEGKPGQNLTDTIMIASLDPKTNQVALISLPRDLYVQIPQSETWIKINSVYQAGLNSRKDSQAAISTLEEILSEITSLDINYYVLINFDGFEKVVDAIGGVNVTNERDIFDSRYPGPNYSYETFELKKGFQHLDGATALKYARERHNDPQGDFGRAKRQQQVMQAVKNKVFSTKTMFNIFALNEIFDALGNNVKTDINPNKLGAFWELAQRLDTVNINNVVVDAWNSDSLLKVSHIFSGDTRVFILVPRVGNFSEIKELAQNVFDLNKIKRRKEEIAKENATVTIINKSGSGNAVNRIKSLLKENLNYKNVVLLNNPDKNLEEKTVVYDLSNGTKPFTLSELAEKLPASLYYDANYQKILQNIHSDILLVIGKDLVPVYNRVEDSVEEWKKAEE